MPRRSWIWVQGAAGVAVVLFVVRFLAANWDEVRTSPVNWALHPAWIAGAILLILGAYGLLVDAWRRLLAAWAPRLPWAAAARIWVLSSMGKYLPGKIWALAGLAMLAQRRGVPPWAAASAAVVQQVISVGTGAALIAATSVAVLEARQPGIRLTLLAIAALAALGTAALAWPPVGRRLIALVARDGSAPEPPRAPLVAWAVAVSLATWAGYGVALWMLARGVFAAVPLSLPEAVGAFTASYLAGLLFLLAPGGLVVREGVFILMLQDRIGVTNAIALAAVSRLAMTAADLAAALPFVLTREAPRDAA